MNLYKALVATALALSSAAACAQFVTGSTGSLGNGTSFLSLSSANVSGGILFAQSVDPASTGGVPQRPVNIVNGTTTLSTSGNWFAAGNNAGGGTATLTLTPGTTGVSFLWGTPDYFNTVKVNTSAGVQDILATSFFQASQLQTYGVAGYVTLRANAGVTINSITFGSPLGAVEIANVTAVPEPGTYALMLSGLAALGGLARRRRASAGPAATAVG